MLEVPSQVKLLVLITNFHYPDGKPLHARLQHECVRKPFSIKAKEGLYVRYDNAAYQLYYPKSTGRLIKKVQMALRETMSRTGQPRGGDLSLALLIGDYTKHFHCVLERSPGHFHSFRYSDRP